jgi:hypothetical protein
MGKVNEFSKQWNPFDPRSLFGTRGLYDQKRDADRDAKGEPYLDPVQQSRKKKATDNAGELSTSKSLLTPSKSNQQASNALPTKLGGY